MTSIADPSLVLRHAAIQATRAPSVYNTQPWYLRLTPTELRLHADPDRWLISMDREARQLMISCGCALFNARASVAADGWTASVVRSTADLSASNLIASVGLIADDGQDTALAELNSYVQALPNGQDQLSPLPDPGELIDRLQAAATAGDTELVPILQDGHRMALTEASDRADQLRRRDGVGRNDHWAAARMFGSSDWSTAPVDTTAHLFAAVLCTRSDTAGDWVAAGESLQRILLELARSGYAADLSVPAIEVAETRARIQSCLGVAGFPQALLQIGQAAVPAAVPQRRLLVDVIHEAIER